MLCKDFAFREGASEEEYTAKAGRPKYPTELATHYKRKSRSKERLEDHFPGPSRKNKFNASITRSGLRAIGLN